MEHASFDSFTTSESPSAALPLVPFPSYPRPQHPREAHLEIVSELAADYCISTAELLARAQVPMKLQSSNTLLQLPSALSHTPGCIRDSPALWRVHRPSWNPSELGLQAIVASYVATIHPINQSRRSRDQLRNPYSTSKSNELSSCPVLQCLLQSISVCWLFYDVHSYLLLTVLQVLLRTPAGYLTLYALELCRNRGALSQLTAACMNLIAHISLISEASHTLPLNPGFHSVYFPSN